MGLLYGDDRRIESPVEAERKELERFHTTAYLDVLEKASNGIFDEAFLYMGLGTPDNPLFPGMYNYAALASGASILGAELILSRKASVVFNPSGGYHHARSQRAAGFCFINDVVLACLKLADAGQRVAFIDVDAHHGDGVQEAFYHRNDVMTISLHESGHTLYPGTGFEHEMGTGEGMGYSLNLPLPVGTYDEIYYQAFRQTVLPLLGWYAPDVLVVELGMDGLSADPLAHLNLTNNVYADILKLLLELKKPILATGGGGYNPENTARGWALCWSVLCNDTYEQDLNIGMGGVMLESTEWFGGLRDRALLTHGGQRKKIDDAVSLSIKTIHDNLFSLHGITP